MSVKRFNLDLPITLFDWAITQSKSLGMSMRSLCFLALFVTKQIIVNQKNGGYAILRNPETGKETQFIVPF